MPDWSDRLLDEEIRAGLHAYRAVSPRQKNAAWAALRARAARQSPLPPVAPDRPQSARWSFARCARALIAAFLDDSPYDRAQQYRAALWQTSWYAPLRHLPHGGAV